MTFRYPEDPSREFRSRVIAIAGDTLQFKGDVVLLNGKPLDERYIKEKAKYKPFVEEQGIITVPEGHVFFMGDNRRGSVDSRHFGPIPVESITGKVLYVCYAKSLSRIGTNVK